MPPTAHEPIAAALLLLAAGRNARTPLALRDAALSFARALKRRGARIERIRAEVAAARRHNREAVALLWGRLA